MDKSACTYVTLFAWSDKHLLYFISIPKLINLLSFEKSTPKYLVGGKMKKTRLNLSVLIEPNRRATTYCLAGIKASRALLNSFQK